MKPRATLEDLKALKDLAEKVKDAISIFNRIAETQIHALDEVISYRQSVRRGNVTLDWDDFLNFLYHEDRALYRLLKRQRPKYFDLKRLCIDTENANEALQVKFADSQIKKYLRRKYGVDFSVRVKSLAA